MTTVSNLSQTGEFNLAMEILSFKLGAEEYGIDIQQVQELRGYDAVTRIANAPSYIKGVTNLRGAIVPIIDLRIKFGHSAPTYDQFTVMIVVNVHGRAFGMVVDSVSDVVNLTQEQCKPPPPIGAAVQSDYLVGIATLEERLLCLINIELLLAGVIDGLPTEGALVDG